MAPKLQVVSASGLDQATFGGFGVLLPAAMSPFAPAVVPAPLAGNQALSWLNPVQDEQAKAPMIATRGHVLPAVLSPFAKSTRLKQVRTDFPPASSSEQAACTWQLPMEDDPVSKRAKIGPTSCRLVEQELGGLGLQMPPGVYADCLRSKHDHHVVRPSSSVSGLQQTIRPSSAPQPVALTALVKACPLSRPQEVPLAPKVQDGDKHSPQDPPQFTSVFEAIRHDAVKHFYFIMKNSHVLPYTQFASCEPCSLVPIWHKITANFDMLVFAGLCTVYRVEDFCANFPREINRCGDFPKFALAEAVSMPGQPKHPPPPPPPVRHVQTSHGRSRIGL